MKGFFDYRERELMIGWMRIGFSLFSNISAYYDRRASVPWMNAFKKEGGGQALTPNVSSPLEGAHMHLFCRMQCQDSKAT